MAENPLLQFDGVVSGYGKKEILHGVTLHVGRGETVCLIGPNGAGKSTVLLTILGYLKPKTGSVLFEGTPIHGLQTHAIVQRGIGFCPQRRNIFPDLTVSEHFDLGGWTVPDAQRKRAARERACRLFPVLKEKEQDKAKTLSGGQRQMLAFGMALMGDPSLLLLDEPSIGLAPMVVESIFASMAQIHSEGIAILIVEQNAAKALAHSHRAYVLEMGQNRHDGPSAALLEDPNVRQMYLGSRAV